MGLCELVITSKCHWSKEGKKGLKIKFPTAPDLPGLQLSGSRSLWCPWSFELRQRESQLPYPCLSPACSDFQIVKLVKISIKQQSFCYFNPNLMQSHDTSVVLCYFLMTKLHVSPVFTLFLVFLSLSGPYLQQIPNSTVLSTFRTLSVCWSWTKNLNFIHCRTWQNVFPFCFNLCGSLWF